MAHRVHVAPADRDHHLQRQLLRLGKFESHPARSESASDVELAVQPVDQPAQPRRARPSTRETRAFSAASSLTGTIASPSLAAANALASTGPHSRCAQRGSRAPGARGSLTTSGPPFSSARVASSSRKPSTAETSAKRCSRSLARAQLGRGLRPAQHQRREQRHRLRRQAEHAAQVVLVARDARAARLEGQRQRLQRVDGALHLGVARRRAPGRAPSSGCSRASAH